METYQLFDLARLSAPHAAISAAACAILMFNRVTGEGLPHANLRLLELAGGEAALAALAAMPLEAVVKEVEKEKEEAKEDGRSQDESPAKRAKKE